MTQRDDPAADNHLPRFFDLSLDLLGIASTRDGRWKRLNAAFSRTLGWTPAKAPAVPGRSRAPAGARAGRTPKVNTGAEASYVVDFPRA